MLRINSTTTRAVTAFDVVGLFCIFGMPPYGFMPQLRRVHYNALHVYCQDNAMFFLQKNKQKNSRASFHRRGYLSKNAREPPLVPPFYPLPSLCQAFSSTLSHRSAQLLYSRYVNMAGTTRDMAENGGKSCRINHPGARGNATILSIDQSPAPQYLVPRAALLKRYAQHPPRAVIAHALTR